MPAPIVFLDTETTGLSLTDDIWEFAAASPTTACRRRHANAINLLTRLDNLKENTP